MLTIITYPPREIVPLISDNARLCMPRHYDLKFESLNSNNVSALSISRSGAPCSNR